MLDSAVITAVTPVIAVFEELQVAYLIGGSLASSVHGIARATLDADLMAALQFEHISSLHSALNQTYYISEPAIEEAIKRRSSFNLIHLDTMVKLDIFMPKSNLFDQQALARRQAVVLDKNSGQTFQVASAEDIILLKLDWFRQTSAESEKQWRDIVGVLRVQASHLDRTYLTDWATRRGLTDYLTKAFKDAGLAAE